MPTYSNPGVYVTESAFSNAAAAGSSTTAAALVGPALRGPIVPTKVSSWIAFKAKFGDIDAAYPLTYAAYHFFVNGGRDAYISRVYHSSAVSASVAMLGTVDGAASATIFTLSASNPGVWGNGLTVTKTAGLTSGSTPTFTLAIKSGGVEVERWSELSLDPDSSRFVSSVINTYSQYVVVTGTVLAFTTAYTVTAATDAAFASGVDGGSVSSAHWNSGVSRLVAVPEELIVNMVEQTTASVVNTAISYCENAGNRFLVIDPAVAATSSDALTATSAYSASSYAAVYYPLLKMVDPSKSGTAAIRTTAPGGALLGLYSRVEAERTVAKAPAGYAYEIRGAYGVAAEYDETQQGTLYDSHINTFKVIPGAGVIVNGARTLKKTDITKYVPVRRTLNHVKSRAKTLTAFAVFEPNNDSLWMSISTRLSTFLQTLWSAGGLKGRTSAEAYFVICNASNNTSVSIENGQVNVQIGVALQTPAEFIVIDVSQFVGGTTTTELA